LSLFSRVMRRIGETLRRDFVAGLLVIVPAGFTILAVIWIVDQLDRLVLPRIWSALGLETSQPPLVGVLATLFLILALGSLTRSFAGRSALRLWEGIVDRIPIARSLYTVLKQFMEAVFVAGSAHNSFSKVVLIEYPRQGILSYAFVTGRLDPPPNGGADPLVTVFVPSTPNPTTGYFLMLPEADTIETGLTVEDAFRLIISAGISQPPPALAARSAARPAAAQPAVPEGSGP
jgi:uncharacterized membrane protein